MWQEKLCINCLIEYLQHQLASSCLKCRKIQWIFIYLKVLGRYLRKKICCKGVRTVSWNSCKLSSPAPPHLAILTVFRCHFIVLSQMISKSLKKTRKGGYETYLMWLLVHVYSTGRLRVDPGSGGGVGVAPQWLHEGERVPAVPALWLSVRWWVSQSSCIIKAHWRHLAVVCVQHAIFEYC